MKTPLSIIALLLLFNGSAKSQNCNVTISGGNCTGNKLTANVSGGKAAKITWYQYGSLNVFDADTISSQASKSVVAGNNGSGSKANQFGFPNGGIFVDANGNLFVADAQNNRIQKWAPGATSGVTVAGGYGAGSAANQLSYPLDVFVDANGNIYVADDGNHRIQKWAPGATSGTTVAGGNEAGSAANQLSGPRGVYVDTNGDIYVADTYNYRVQKWASGANAGVTVAGGNGYGDGANQFGYPIDVYLDGAKNVYVADTYTDDAAMHRVQKWAPGATSGATVAGGNGEGSNANQFGYLLAIYVDAAGNVYTADNGVSGTPVSRIQKWAAGAANGITVAGGHSNGWDVLQYPTGVALDKNGLIYVLDGTYNPRVQKYIPTNGITDNKFTPTQPGSYTVKTVLKNGCTATSSSIIVRAKPATPTIYPSQTGSRGNLCSGGIDTFFVQEWDEVTKYTWKIPPQCSLMANYNDSVVIAIPQGFKAGALSVSGSNSCGTSAWDIMYLLGKPLQPNAIKGPKYVSANQQGVIYSVTDLNSGHNWIVPTGAVIQYGQGSATISVNWGSTSGTVSVNSYNACGASPYKKIDVQVTGSIAANAQDYVHAEIINTSDALVFPNPAKSSATVKFNSTKQTNYTIQLQNMNGAILMQKNILTTKGMNSINLDLSKYSAGVYLINIKNAERKIILKLTKQ